MNRTILQEAYEHYYAGLFSYAMYLSGNRADAEDLVSETFVKAFLSWNGQGSLRAWLYRVLKNLFIDEVRRKKRFLNEGDKMLAYAEAPPPENEGIRSEDLEWLHQKIREMPPADQELLLLTLYSRLSDAEIAAQLKTDPANVRVRRHRLKEKLKQQAERERYDDR
ncbi:MAG: sigma-70 family RNA polymerase sigma factor [Solobacterium sp.]|nr:sigma-70 family RNA polymerase sigma factor [Solobacterium sp.]MBR2830391.1 sigma-70 family RNA polymerase sigma factor [Solobacterium sp.]